MADRQMKKVFRCFAYGRDREYQAFCLNLDIAVQGKSLSDVRHSLHDAISLYLEAVHEAPAEDRIRLLNRSAPVSRWLTYYAVALRSLLRSKDKHHKFFKMQHAI